jgi:hypothetical protein
MKEDCIASQGPQWTVALEKNIHSLRIRFYLWTRLNVIVAVSPIHKIYTLVIQQTK